MAKKNGLKKLDKNGLKSRRNPSKLTGVQAEVVHMIFVERLTIKQISRRRQTSVQNVYQIIGKIRKKGLFHPLDLTTLKNATHISKNGLKLWSYHGLHFLLRPYYFFPRYERFVSSVGVVFGDWVFKFHRGSVEVQSKGLVEFRDADRLLAVKRGEESFNRALGLACNKFGFLVFKDGKANIRLVNHHLERGDSPVARGCKEHYLRVRGEDGKTWFMIDRSRGGLNHEYVNECVLPNSEVLESFFNDVRRGEWSDVKKMLYTMSTVYAENIKKHLSVLDRMERTLKKIEGKL